jgi:TatD DNase family protein
MIKLLPRRRLFDAHCHLTDIPGYPKHHIDEAVVAGVAAVVAVSNDLKESEKSYKLQQQFPGLVFAAAGVHPEALIPGSDLFDSDMDEEQVQITLDKLQRLLIKDKFSFIGECGLDYYWLLRNKEITPAQVDRSQALQQILLMGQLKLARLFNLPVSLHSRAAEAECIKLIKGYQGRIATIFHSFTGTYEQAAEIIEMGCVIGINGIITYKSASELRNTIKKLVAGHSIKEPEDLYQLGFVLETDAPLLIPGNSTLGEKYNTPKQIPFLWQYLYNFLNS